MRVPCIRATLSLLRYQIPWQMCTPNGVLLRAAFERVSVKYALVPSHVSLTAARPVQVYILSSVIEGRRHHGRLPHRRRYPSHG